MRVCLIGYGNIAKKHIEVFRALGCHVVASSNRSEKGNNAARLEAGIPATYTDYLVMVEKEKPDAIINCASFEQMYVTTKNLIPLGIPLLIEKPAGLSLKETQELILLQEEHKTPVQVALNRRHYSIFQNTLKIIGEQGNIDMISVEWSERPFRAKTLKGYSDLLIGQHLYANTIHGIDMLDYYSGGIQNYDSFCTAGKGYFSWNMAFSGISRSGTIVNFTSSWSSPVPWRVVIYSKGKRFEFAPLETCKLFEENTTGYTQIQPERYDEEFKAGFYLQTQSFMQLVKSGNDEHPHNLRSTLVGMEIAENLFNKLYIGK